MNAQELFMESCSLKEVCIPITNDLIVAFKKSCPEVGIEILSQDRLNDKIVVFKLKLSRGTFNLFQLGAITHINDTVPSSAQKDIDNLFKDNLQ
jgi:hypothetical protein